METYVSYVEQEEGYYKQLETLEQCQHAVIDSIYRYGHLFDEQMTEEVLLSIHRLEDSIRLDLLHVRLTKAFQAYHMDKTTGE